MLANVNARAHPLSWWNTGPVSHLSPLDSAASQAHSLDVSTVFVAHQLRPLQNKPPLFPVSETDSLITRIGNPKGRGTLQLGKPQNAKFRLVHWPSQLIFKRGIHTKTILASISALCNNPGDRIVVGEAIARRQHVSSGCRGSYRILLGTLRLPL